MSPSLLALLDFLYPQVFGMILRCNISPIKNSRESAQFGYKLDYNWGSNPIGGTLSAVNASSDF
jgi:hypothetical protein